MNPGFFYEVYMESNKMKKCPNCGADIDIHIDKCPYCGYINEQGAEEQYLGNLEKIKDTLDVLDDEIESSYWKEVLKAALLALKTVLISGVIVIIAVVFVLNFGDKNGYWGFSGRYEQEKEQLVWELGIYPQLDELFEQGKYDEIEAIIYSEENSGKSFYNWHHDQFMRAYHYCQGVTVELQELLDNGGMNKWDGGLYTYDALYIYYRQYTLGFDALTGDDLAYMEERRDEVVDIIHNRMGFTDEYLESIRDDLMNYSVLSFDKSDDLGRKYYPQYK